jgi:hypothetical protein
MIIRDTTTHESKADAEAYGMRFEQSLGWGYDPSFTVWQDQTTGRWVCSTRHASSCD